MRKLTAFSLAEVLITLTIIGVVAAITIPPVQRKVFESEQKTLYKKAYTTLSNALLKIKADQGYQMNCYYGNNSSFTDCSAFKIAMKETLKTVKYCENNAYSQGCIPEYKGVEEVHPSWSGSCNGFLSTYIKINNPAFVLSDGTIVIGYSSTLPLYAVDINGRKPPNKWGYDIFTFYINHLENDSVKLDVNICSFAESGGKTSAQMRQEAFK